MAYWQIAAGSDGRDYSEYFLKHGIAFVGGDNQTQTMEHVEEGDIVVLKIGKTMKAAGTVVKRNGTHRGCYDKEWIRDVDGWDLPAYCYVDWIKANPDVYNESLGRATISGINDNLIIEEAGHILDTGTERKNEPEPSDFKPVEDSKILKGLIEVGLRPSSADELTKAISRIRLLADYYYYNCNWKEIREHETRTFLVVPLLLALGWAEQQIKIELPSGQKRKRIDIACFRKNYEGNKDDCIAIVETKGFRSGLDYAQDQAQSYSEYFPECKTVIITNGYCYKIYLRSEDGGFKTNPSAYMNLLKPKDKYPLDPDNVKGTLEAITELLPNRYAVESQDQE